MILTFFTDPSRRIHATVAPFLSVPSWTRTSASRPRKGEASRLVTWACSGAPSVYLGAGIVFLMTSNNGSRSGLSGLVPFSGRVSEA